MPNCLINNTNLTLQGQMISIAFNDFLHTFFDKLPNDFHINIFDHVKLPSTDVETFLTEPEEEIQILIDCGWKQQ
jgi:hypothetical protein